MSLILPMVISISSLKKGNHITILDTLELPYEEYTYLNEKKDDINWKGIKDILRSAEPGLRI